MLELEEASNMALVARMRPRHDGKTAGENPRARWRQPTMTNPRNINIPEIAAAVRAAMARAQVDGSFHCGMGSQKQITSLVKGGFNFRKKTRPLKFCSQLENSQI